MQGSSGAEGAPDSSLAERTLADILAALASDAISPGSGAAAAVVLAFAAACAGKALAISEKHRPAEGNVKAAEEQLVVLVRRALERADADARFFAEFTHHKDVASTKELLEADEVSRSLAQELAEVLNEIEPTIHPVVAADIAAARTLLSAVSAIEERIQAENQRDARPGP
jgi:formiminotetrahydrofolate cyclodeaminase